MNDENIMYVSHTKDSDLMYEAIIECQVKYLEYVSVGMSIASTNIFLSLCPKKQISLLERLGDEVLDNSIGDQP